MPDHGERDRAAFEALWPTRPFDKLNARYVAREFFEAGAAHGRADARAELERVRAERDEAVERATKLEKFRDLASNAAGFLTERLDAAEDALPEGFRVDAEHNLAECVEALAEDRAYWRKQGLAANLEACRLRLEHGACATPPPDSALRERVVEAAMAWLRMWRRIGLAQTGSANSEVRELEAACAALDAATPKPTVAVREAAGRIRKAIEDGPNGTLFIGVCGTGSPGEVYSLTHARTGDLRAVLDALDAKGAK